ncbi:UNVERIFIED_CONTAM: hypothetical protein Slati_3505200 [Sesamum latifolium]|uniref:Uncharacterized protein n=1 Tax=Sesamum latifolium TaxID=2727402 RepID=A0AAW2UJG0_9LAMI
MENLNQTTDKQKGTAPPIGTQALQVITGAPSPPGGTGSTPAALPPAPLPPRVTDPVADLPRRSTFFGHLHGGAVTGVTESHPTRSGGCRTRARACSSPSTSGPAT